MMYRLLTVLFCIASLNAQAESPNVRVLRGHEGTTRPVFSPDGRLLATGSDDMTVRLWDTETTRQIRSIEGDGIRQVVFSPDGSLLAGLADQRIIFLNLNGAKIRELKGHTDTVRGVAFSPDGRLLASGGDDETVRIWDVATGKIIRSLKIEREGEIPEVVWSVAFSPNGELLAVGSGDGVGESGHVRILTVANAAVLQTFDGPEGRQVVEVAFSPDGQLLASGSFLAGTITLRSTGTWQVVRQWDSGGALRALAFSPAGDTLAAGIDREIVLWDTASGRKQRTLGGHDNWVMHLSFSPDGTMLASGSSDHTVRLWRVR